MALYIVQGMDDLVAWILNDCTHLEGKVRERRICRFFAKEITRFLAEKIEVECYLEQVFVP